MTYWSCSLSVRYRSRSAEFGLLNSVGLDSIGLLNSVGLNLVAATVDGYIATSAWVSRLLLSSAMMLSMCCSSMYIMHAYAELALRAALCVCTSSVLQIMCIPRVVQARVLIRTQNSMDAHLCSCLLVPPIAIADFGVEVQEISRSN